MGAQQQDLRLSFEPHSRQSSRCFFMRLSPANQHHAQAAAAVSMPNLSACCESCGSGGVCACDTHLTAQGAQWSACVRGQWRCGRTRIEALSPTGCLASCPRGWRQRQQRSHIPTKQGCCGEWKQVVKVKWRSRRKVQLLAPLAATEQLPVATKVEAHSQATVLQRYVVAVQVAWCGAGSCVHSTTEGLAKTLNSMYSQNSPWRGWVRGCYACDTMSTCE